MTNSLHLFGGDARALADTLRGRIKREFGLTISVGVSFNKVFAKLGSDYKKPDATTVIARDNWRDIVFPLPVGDLLFVGRSAQELLGRYGVRTIGELSKCSEEMLETLMGKMGSQLYRYANGLDDSPVRGAADRGPIKSVGNSTTFRRDLTRWMRCKAASRCFLTVWRCACGATGSTAAAYRLASKTAAFRSFRARRRSTTART